MKEIGWVDELECSQNIGAERIEQRVLGPDLVLSNFASTKITLPPLDTPVRPRKKLRNGSEGGGELVN